jgi:bla regulator protein BlaR1
MPYIAGIPTFRAEAFMRRFLPFLLLILIAVSPAIAKKHPDIAERFRGFDGCFVLYDMKTHAVTRYNQKRAAIPKPPCSTFKIFNALIGLQTGVLQDENTTFKWDGTPQYLKVWEHDQTLASAVKYSVVWYFQRVAAQVGPVRMQHWLDTVGYGNRNISAGITSFWLAPNSLKISADDQVSLLIRLYRDGLPFDQRAMEIVRHVLVLRSDNGLTFSGKTGSGEWGDTTLGWFVGHLTTRDGGEYVFATNIEAKSGADGVRARAITEQILDDMGLMPLAPKGKPKKK